MKNKSINAYITNQAQAHLFTVQVGEHITTLQCKQFTSMSTQNTVMMLMNVTYHIRTYMSIQGTIQTS